MRLRIFFILIGGLLVVAVFTFPYWQPYVMGTPEEVTILFPGLPIDMQSAFANLPPDQQQAYLGYAASDPETALRMVTTALQPRLALPEEDQEMPELNAPVPVAAGRFVVIDPVRYGQGRVTIFQTVDGFLWIRFEDFFTLNGPDLRVALSAVEAPETVDAMNAGESEAFEVGALLNSFGSMNYERPEGYNLSPYRSVVIFSAALDMIYTYAPLSIRQ